MFVDDPEDMPARLENPAEPVLHDAQLFAFGRFCGVSDESAYYCEVFISNRLNVLEGDPDPLRAKRGEPCFDRQLPRIRAFVGPDTPGIEYPNFRCIEGYERSDVFRVDSRLVVLKNARDRLVEISQ